VNLFDSLTTGRSGALHAWDGDGFERIPWSRIVAEAQRVAVGLKGAGVEPGTPVATVLTNSPQTVTGLLGVWLAGGAVASLPVPARAMKVEEYTAQIAGLSHHVGSPLLVLDEKILQFLPEELGQELPIRTWDSLPADGPLDPSPPGDDELAFVQYSSGSTSMPKGCMLTTRAIGNQLEIIGDMVNTVPGEETVSSWLPLSHDMGVFGCLLFAWAHDHDLALSSPERFMYDPRTWFGDCADFGATLSAGPPSALHVAARAQRTVKQMGELVLRGCVIGAERIPWSTLEAATAAFAPHGLKPSAWLPAYGLAEATLVVSVTGLDEEPSRIHLDGDALSEGEIELVDAGHEGATAMVSVGRPCDGVEVRLSEPGRLSELLVRSTSLFTGYFGQPELTAEQLVDGELATGDLGFEHDGQLYVVGRADDLLSVRGRNIYAREIEAAVDALEEVRSGCSTIVDVEDGYQGRARLVMLVELKDEEADCRRLAKDASKLAKGKAGVWLDECVFLAKGVLPKTPSGKIQRFRCRHLVATDTLEPIERVPLRRRRAGAPAAPARRDEVA
jgi:fatty-acyl-CoA synthase